MAGAGGPLARAHGRLPLENDGLSICQCCNNCTDLTRSCGQDAPPEVRVIDFGCSQLVEEGTKLAKRTGELSGDTAATVCAVRDSSTADLYGQQIISKSSRSSAVSSLDDVTNLSLRY